MTVINYKHKFIFIHLPKTAGSSLELALYNFRGKKDIFSEIDVRNKNYIPPPKKEILNINGYYNFFCSFIKILPFAKLIFKFNDPPDFNVKIPLLVENRILPQHCSIRVVKKMVGDDFFNEAIKFTIVRNPYDQFLSYAYHCFDFKKINHEQFRKFTKQKCYYFFNKEYSIISLNNTFPYNKIIKYENLKEDIEQLGKLLKFPENLYEIFKNINALKYVEKDFSLIDKDSQEIIYKNSYRFFEQFGYSKNINER